MTELTYVAPEKADIYPADTMALAGRKVLAYYYGRMLSEEARVRGEGDVDAIHDMRVATRRLRSALRIFGPFYRRSEVKPLRRGLRRVAAALGAVRDLDVMRLKCEAYVEAHQDGENLRSIIDDLFRQRQAAYRALLDTLEGKAYAELLTEFSVFLSASDPVHEDEQAARVRDTAPRLIYTQYGTLRAYEDGLAAATPDTLHSLRIEAKRFRYLLEAFTEVLGPEVKQAINAAKALQDHLGELQDARVAVDALNAYLAQSDHRAEVKRAIRKYRSARNAEKRALRAQVRVIWAAFTHPEVRRALALGVAAL